MVRLEGAVVCLLLAGQRPSSLNASGLIVEGPSTTQTSWSDVREPDVQSIRDVRLLNHLVSAQQYGLRNREAERLCRLDVYRQHELGRLLHGKLARLGAL